MWNENVLGEDNRAKLVDTTRWSIVLVLILL